MKLGFEREVVTEKERSLPLIKPQKVDRILGPGSYMKKEEFSVKGGTFST